VASAVMSSNERQGKPRRVAGSTAADTPWQQRNRKLRRRRSTGDGADAFRIFSDRLRTISPELPRVAWN